MIQTAEGALNEVHALLQRMRELAVQAGSSTLSFSERSAIGEELFALRSEIDNIASRTRFNGLNLLQGALMTSTASVVGPVTDAADTVTVSLDVSGGDPATTYTISNVGSSVTLTNTSTLVAQTLTVASLADGGAQTLDFTALGIRLTLQDDIGVGDGLASTQIAAELGGGTIITDAGNGSTGFRVGPGSTDNIVVTFGDMRSTAIGDPGDELSVLITDNQAISSVTKADVLLSSIDAAIVQVSTQRAKLGAAQNRVEAAINGLGVVVENLSASESRIRDADIAAVSSELVSAQIMQQAGVAVLAQANQASQAVLQLLQ